MLIFATYPNKMSNRISDIPLKILKAAGVTATRKARRENKKLGLSQVVIQNNQVLEIFPDGSVKVLEQLDFSTVTVPLKKVKLGKKNSKD